MRPPRRGVVFAYPPLFLSTVGVVAAIANAVANALAPLDPAVNQLPLTPGSSGARALATARPEEHTSELQSQSNIVCRLLLEKKNPSRPSQPPIAAHMTSSA